MKISKLFHWLYASLMFLPFVSVVSTSLYYAFNKNAVIPSVTKEVSKEVNFNQVAKYYDGNLQEFEIVNISSFKVLRDDSTYYANIDYTFDYGSIFVLRSYYEGNFTVLNFWNGNYTQSYDFLTISDFRFISNNPSYFVQFNGDIGSILTLNVFNLTQMFGSGNEPTLQEFNSWFPNDYYDYTLSEHIVIPNYDEIEVQDEPINHFWLPSFGAIGYNIENTISWVLGSLFGLNVANGIGYAIVKLFTYWLIISIVWLLFDLLMYVPNLFHRWLDKGAIE